MTRALIPSHAPANVDTPFITSLNPFDRWQIVNATQQFRLPGEGPRRRHRQQAVAVRARRLPGLRRQLGPGANTRQGRRPRRMEAPGDARRGTITSRSSRRASCSRSATRSCSRPSPSACSRRSTERSSRPRDRSTTSSSASRSRATTPPTRYGVANNSRDLPVPQPDAEDAAHAGPRLRRRRSSSSIPNRTTASCRTSPAQPFQWHFIGTDWNGNEVAFTAPGRVRDPGQGAHAERRQRRSARPTTALSTSDSVRDRAVHRLRGRVRRLAHAG